VSSSAFDVSPNTAPPARTVHVPDALRIEGKAPFDQNFCPLSLEGEPLKNHGHRAQHAI